MLEQSCLWGSILGKVQALVTNALNSHPIRAFFPPGHLQNFENGRF